MNRIQSQEKMTPIRTKNMHISQPFASYIYIEVFCYKVNKTSVTQAFAKLHALCLQGKVYYSKIT